jgi:acyl-CoA synthetase (AMP-forming)/AMP-acid ligase II
MTVRQIPPGRYRTVVEILGAAAEINPDLEAYVEPATGGTPRTSLNFSQWERAADGVSGLLEAQGVQKGDVVALVLPSCIDYAVCYAAAMRLGAITSGINPRIGRLELDSIMARARPTLSVVDPTLGVALPATAGSVVPRQDAAAAFGGPGPRRRPLLDARDLVAVVWTSGTTGRPKGAVFDHTNLAAVARGTDVLSHPGDRRLSPLPFAHVGYMTRAWDEIAHGVTTVITPTPWRAADALSIIETERITVAQGVPTQWALVLELDTFDEADLSSLRIAGTGAAPVPATMVARMRRRLGVPVVVRYTSTETSLGTGTAPGDPDEVVATTVGRPVPGVELALIDEQGGATPTGEVGRVHLRSGAVMRGYWADQPASGRPTDGGSGHLIDHEASASVLSPDGWVRTGDFGMLTAEGNLTLVGRDNELYIRGGYNVLPAEVEAVLVTHPGIAAVAVVGTPDDVLGEIGVAFVVRENATAPEAMPGLDELRRHCAAQLADYKAPDLLVELEALPVTPMMKVDRRTLGQHAARAASGRRSRPVSTGGSR